MHCIFVLRKQIVESDAKSFKKSRHITNKVLRRGINKYKLQELYMYLSLISSEIYNYDEAVTNHRNAVILISVNKR